MNEDCLGLTTCVLFQIAGIRILIRAPGGATFSPLAQIFGEFIYYGTYPPDTQPEIDIECVVKSDPIISGFETSFESERSKMLTRNGEYCFMLFGGDGHISSSAVFDRSVRRVVIYCSDDFFEGGNRDVLRNPFVNILQQVVLMFYLSSRGGFILHAAGSVFGDRAFVFAGQSGAGKSTLSRHINKSEAGSVLSDERVIIRHEGSHAVLYGTPWPGEALISENKSAQLGGICFMVKSNENRLEKISPAEASRRLMPVAIIPWYDSTCIGDIFSTIDKVVRQTDSYLFYFKNDPDVINYLGSALES